jgi:hypothetical protein
MNATASYTIERIRSEMMADGSHWWDRGSMRFFGTRVLGGVFQGEGGIYFVTSEQPPHGPRKYNVRQYNPETRQVDTVGDFGQYNDARTAKREAERLAGAPQQEEPTLAPLSPSFQLAHDLTTHGECHCNGTMAAWLIRTAKAHHAMMEDYCSVPDADVFDDEGDPTPRLMAVRTAIAEVAERIGAKGVVFSGDPRGCTVKIVCRNGFTNDWGKEGVCVPTND